MSLPVGNYAPFNLTYRDKGGEIGTVSGFGTFVNFTEVDEITAALTAWSLFIQSTNIITLGVLSSQRYLYETLVNPITKASSPSAQRENKLLVRYHDSVTLQKATMTIPTIDLPNCVFLTEAKDFVSMSLWGSGVNTDITNWVTRFQNFVRIPTPDMVAPGNATVIDSLEFVGRNT